MFEVLSTRRFVFCFYEFLINFQKLPIGIKWPNDIFYDGKIKLGGVLVKSSLLGDRISVKIGKILFFVYRNNYGSVLKITG